MATASRTPKKYRENRWFCSTGGRIRTISGDVLKCRDGEDRPKKPFVILIAFVAALGEGFRDKYRQNVNDDPTVSGTPSQCVPDLYPGSEYIQQNPDAAGTVTIDRTGIVPALVFDDGYFLAGTS